MTERDQLSVYRTAALHARAAIVVAEFKHAHNLPMLSPELCRDLADRIAAAMIEAREL